jgi:hypothetical protein
MMDIKVFIFPPTMTIVNASSSLLLITLFDLVAIVDGSQCHWKVHPPTSMEAKISGQSTLQ